MIHRDQRGGADVFSDYETQLITYALSIEGRSARAGRGGGAGGAKSIEGTCKSVG